MNEIPGVYSDHISTMKFYINSMEKHKVSPKLFLSCYVTYFRGHQLLTSLIAGESSSWLTQDLMKRGRQLKFYRILSIAKRLISNSFTRVFFLFPIFHMVLFLCFPLRTQEHTLLSSDIEILENYLLRTRNGEESTDLVDLGKDCKEIKRPWRIPKGF